MLLRLISLLSLAALAIGTWILSTQSRTPKSAPASSRDSLPGYYLKGTVMTDYDASGAPNIKIAAERIEPTQRLKRAEIIQPAGSASPAGSAASGSVCAAPASAAPGICRAGELCAASGSYPAHAAC